jgi:Niemann-Pick C1 protein
MATWNQKDRPEFMNVAWTTEKSIQDELDRTSKAEILTMVISYLLMFAYIAIALGKIRMSLVSCFVSFAIVDSAKLRK